MAKRKNVNDTIEKELEKLSYVQKNYLAKQVDRFNKLNTLPGIIHMPITDESGRVLLNSGSLIYGAGNFSVEKVYKISSIGLISDLFLGDLIDDNNLFCANFYKITRDVSLEEYNNDFKYNDERFPFSPLGSMKGANSLAFIVSKNDNELFDFDLYKIGTDESSIARSFTDIRKIPFQLYDEVSSILYGVPSSMIEGIVLGDELFRNIDFVKYIINSLPNCYIATKNGYVIYDHSMKVESVMDGNVGFRIGLYNLITDKYRRKKSGKRRF